MRKLFSTREAARRWARTGNGIVSKITFRGNPETLFIEFIQAVRVLPEEGPLADDIYIQRVESFNDEKRERMNRTATSVTAW